MRLLSNISRLPASENVVVFAFEFCVGGSWSVEQLFGTVLHLTSSGGGDHWDGWRVRYFYSVEVPEGRWYPWNATCSPKGITPPRKTRVRGFASCLRRWAVVNSVLGWARRVVGASAVWL